MGSEGGKCAKNRGVCSQMVRRRPSNPFYESSILSKHNGPVPREGRGYREASTTRGERNAGENMGRERREGEIEETLR